jgi:ATP-dependent Lon protease
VNQQMKIVPVRWIDEVLDLALERPVTPLAPIAPVVEPAREPDKEPVQADVKH